jgi:hypothetical protein
MQRMRHRGTSLLPSSQPTLFGLHRVMVGSVSTIVTGVDALHTVPLSPAPLIL